uniref:Mobile element protein n=1 Tax=Klebsiella pneumoniae TaxID=573 RepID=A0A6G9HMR2_KLEPN|nr:Mobile element protein [Klebsiella pneumoniae]
MSFLDAEGLRDIEVEAVAKMLTCGARILGVKEFGCETRMSAGKVPDQIMRQPCNPVVRKEGHRTCGQQHVLNCLPGTSWVHLVFTKQTR